MAEERGTLRQGEPHPEAFSAAEYLASLGSLKLSTYQEAFASVSLSGNRTSEILSETMHRFMTGQPVSDRYILGLAWAVKKMEEKDGN